MKPPRSVCWGFAVVIGIATACHRGPAANGAATAAAHTATPPAAGPPRLDRLAPPSADISRGEIIEVVASGAGFDSLNTVRFGPLEIRQVPRRTAGELRFVVPLDDAMRPERGGAPPQPLDAGPYAVSIVTRAGASNAVTFTVRRGP